MVTGTSISLFQTLILARWLLLVAVERLECPPATAARQQLKAATEGFADLAGVFEMIADARGPIAQLQLA